MKIVRIISYESDNPDVMEKQISQSMPDGLREYPHMKIRVVTLTDHFIRWLSTFAAILKEEA